MIPNPVEADLSLDYAEHLYETTEFYRWFYDRYGVRPAECTYATLPILQKADILAYESETGRPYYGEVPPHLKEQARHLETSGTTGRPMEVALTVTDIQANYTILDRVFAASGAAWRVMLVYSEPLMQILGPLSAAPGNKLLAVRPGDMFLPAQMTSLVAEFQPDVIFDATGEWIEPLADADEARWKSLFSSRRPLLMYMQAGPQVLERLRRLGLRPVRFYPSTDFGGIGMACPYSEHMHLNPDRPIFVQTAQGLAATGEGLLVGDLFSSVLPLVKYANGDYVRLSETTCSCGVSPRDVEVMGRDLAVKVPHVNGYYVDIQAVQTILASYGYRVFSMLVPIRPEPGAVEREWQVLATFIGQEGRREPVLNKKLAAQAWEAGSGLLYPGYTAYVPVIEVNRQELPLVDPTSRKPRVFLDLTRLAGKSELLEPYRHLLAILTRTGYQVRLDLQPDHGGENEWTIK